MGRSLFRKNRGVDSPQNHLDSLFPAGVGNLVCPVGGFRHHRDGHQIRTPEAVIQVHKADLVVGKSHFNIRGGKSRKRGEGQWGQAGAVFRGGRNEFNSHELFLHEEKEQGNCLFQPSGSWFALSILYINSEAFDDFL
jgi:hypothetical protein